MPLEEWQDLEPMPTDTQQSEPIRQNEEVQEQPHKQVPTQTQMTPHQALQLV